MPIGIQRWDGGLDDLTHAHVFDGNFQSFQYMVFTKLKLEWRLMEISGTSNFGSIFESAFVVNLCRKRKTD